MVLALFRLLLFAYPPSLRREHGAEMRAVVAARWRDQRSFVARTGFVVDLLRDSFMSWPRAWRGASAHHRHTVGLEFRPMRHVSSDVRDACRLFRRSPAFAVGAVFTLALGIGASTAVFSLADATILHPLPIHDADHVVQTEFSWSYPDFRDVANQQTAFSLVAAWAYPPLGITHDGGILQVDGAGVSGDFFALAGQRPMIGRLFTAADDEPGRAPVAVMSERLWRRVFAADPTVVGSILLINGKAATVVGVSPASFRGFSLQIAPELFVPLTATPDLATGFLSNPALLTQRDRVWFNWAGRLKPGATLTQADQQTRAIYFQQRPNANPKDLTNPTPWFSPIAARAMGATTRPRAAGGSNSAGDLRRFVWILIAATSVVLILTCATVANLLLVRLERRRFEFAIRGALGAGRARLARLLLVESLGIGILGGLAGAGLASLALRLFETFALPGQIAIADLHLAVNGSMLAISTGLGVLTSLAFGMSPVWRLKQIDAVDSIRAGGRSTARSRLRGALVGAQVALCVLLMGGTLAFGRALEHALSLDLGFNTTETTMATINPTLARLPSGRVHAFQQQAIDQLRAQPRIRAAAWSAIRPMSGAMVVAPVFEGYQPAKDEDVSVQSNIVSDGYFDALAIPIATGRAFSALDTNATPLVAVVSAAMAKRYWPAGAMGGRISLENRGAADPKWITIVGIAGDVHRAIGEPAPLLLYLPAAQSTGPLSEMDYLIVRTSEDPSGLAADLRATLHGVDAAMPITRVITMQSHVDAALMAHRLGLTLFLLFTALSAVLTGLGLYAVVSTAVARRTREIGIRVALGAERSTVLRLVLREGAGPIVGGLGIGLAAFVASARLIQQFMFSLPVASPAVVVVLMGSIGALATVAVVMPARRALAIDPTVALRVE